MDLAQIKIDVTSNLTSTSHSSKALPELRDFNRLSRGRKRSFKLTKKLGEGIEV